MRFNRLRQLASNNFGKRLLQLSCLVAGVVLFPCASHALSSSQVSINFVTDPLLVSDSNNCSGGDGPRAAYVGFRVTNTSGTTLTNLQANLSGFATGFSLAGGQPATQYIGTLASGASRTVYWYISYPCHTSTTKSSNLTVTISDAAAGTVTATQTVTSNSSISANAGGLIRTTVLGPGAVVGQIITYDVEYSFGNVSGPQGAQPGDRFNIQPAGNTNFNAGCLQLETSEILTSGVNAIAAGTKDRLFFQATDNQGGSDNRVKVRYYFLYRCDGVSTTAQSYAAQTSGSNNIKYTGNYGTYIGYPSFPSASNPFTITKSASATNLPTGGTVTYTVTIRNNSSLPALFDRITDTLPSGVTYGSLTADSQVTAANSSSTPASGATGTISWLGIPFLSYQVPANGTIVLKYTANIPNTDRDYTNSVSGTVGVTTFGPASTIVRVGAGIISGTLYEDADGNNTLATGEPRLPANIDVQLLDSNGNVVATVQTDSNGNYSFNEVSPGNGYQVRVVVSDPQIPTTYTIGTANPITGINVPARTTVANQNFGFDIASNPNVLLVKRITRINNNTSTNGGDDLAAYIDSTNNPYDDNNLDTPTPNPPDTNKWLTPSTFIIGGINGGTTQPGDEVEYTIYFLSAGNSTAQNVLVCDRIPQGLSFIPNAFNGNPPPASGGLTTVDRGIVWLRSGAIESLTNVSDGDAAQFFAAGVEPSTVYPKINCGGANINGAVVVNLGNLTNATSAGAPSSSYGFIRFRARLRHN